MDVKPGNACGRTVRPRERCVFGSAAILCLALFAAIRAAAQAPGAGPGVFTRHTAVLALRPVGYWPADDGQGKVLHDRSGSANHGTIYSVPWQDGLLVLQNDVYQWIQIHARESYRSRSFSMGGWVFSTLHKREPTGSDKELRFGALIVGQPFTLRNGGKLKWAAIWGADLKHTSGAMLRFGLPA